MLLGCGATSEPAGSSDPAASQEAATEDSAVNDEPQSEIVRELSKLPEADRTLAEAQKVCPVTGEPLGSMGPPIKVTVDGRSLFVCCEGCQEDAKKNFDEYIAKLESRSPATID
jgi:hypothetical protein